jgi:hypothetical protein
MSNRSESPLTQAQAFKSIMMLTTRYPGLRRLFNRHLLERGVEDSPMAIASLWMRPGDEVSLEWQFLLKFTAFCISKSEVSDLLEEVQPSELGSLRQRRLGIVERLLVLFSRLATAIFTSTIILTSVRQCGPWIPEACYHQISRWHPRSIVVLG